MGSGIFRLLALGRYPRLSADPCKPGCFFTVGNDFILKTPPALPAFQLGRTKMPQQGHVAVADLTLARKNEEIHWWSVVQREDEEYGVCLCVCV